MRPPVLPFISVLLLAAPASAQYQFGAVAGPQYVFTRAAVNEDLDLPEPEGLDIPTISGIGYHFGVWYRSERYHMVQFRAGLNWSYRPFKQEFDEVEVGSDGAKYYYSGERRTRLNYLEMPLQGQYYFWRGAHAEAGLVFGRLMYGNNHEEGDRWVVLPDGSTYVPESPDVDDKNTDAFARFELAMTLGFGYDFKKGLVLGASYNRALSRIEYEEDTFTRSWFDQVRINVGYDFLHPKGRRVYRRR